MKNRKYRAGLRAQMQPTYCGFEPFKQQQQQMAAKIGTVEDTGSTDNQIKAIADSDPARMTVGGALTEALRATPVASVGVIHITKDLAARSLIVLQDPSADVVTTVEASAGTTLVANITIDEPGQSSSPLTNAIADGVGVISTPINAGLATRKPSLSTKQFIDLVESVLNEETGDVEAIVVIDQPNGVLKVWSSTEANAQTAYNAVAALEDPQPGNFAVDSTTTSTSREFGE